MQISQETGRLIRSPGFLKKRKGLEPLRRRMVSGALKEKRTNVLFYIALS